MSINGRTISDHDQDVKCSLSVSVLCDYKVQVRTKSIKQLKEMQVTLDCNSLLPFSFPQGPQTLEKSGACDYVSDSLYSKACILWRSRASIWLTQNKCCIIQFNRLYTCFTCRQMCHHFLITFLYLGNFYCRSQMVCLTFFHCKRH